MDPSQDNNQARSMDEMPCANQSIVPPTPTYTMNPEHIRQYDARVKPVEMPFSGQSTGPSTQTFKITQDDTCVGIRDILPTSMQGSVDEDSDHELPMEFWETTPFTSKELRLKPKQQKCPRKYTPAEKKDEEYYNQRAKNSRAVRRSRKIKEEKIRRMTIRLQFLEADHAKLSMLNAQYRAERAEVLEELMKLKRRMDKVEPIASGNPILPSPEEKQPQDPKNPYTNIQQCKYQ